MFRRNRKFQFTAETLEERRVMDGTVVVSLVGNTLSVTGDDLRNTLFVTMNGANLKLEGNTGLEGTPTTFKFQSFSNTTLELGGLDFSQLNVKFNLKGGDDVVHFGDGNAQLTMKSLGVDAGAGNDTVVLNKTAIAGNASIKMFRSASENESDTVACFSDNQVGGEVNIQTGGGNDQVFGTDGSSLVFGKRLKIDVGAGDDGVALRNVRGPDIDVRLGDGADLLLSQASSVTRQFKVNGGKGADNVTINGNGSFAQLAVDLGEGNDVARVESFNVTDLRVSLGKGNDTLTAGALRIAQSTAFDGGSETDTLNFTVSNSLLPSGAKAPKSFEIQNIA